MPIWVPGSSCRRVDGQRRRRAGGFTLIELMVVLAIVAIGAALVSLAVRDPAQTRLETEAARLVALLETARTEARTGGMATLWVPGSSGDDTGSTGFRFLGLPQAMQLPTQWLDARVSAQVIGAPALTLGPEAILPPQRLVLRLDDQRIEIGSDGLAAFAVVDAEPAP